ncbi:MAG TPA: FecR family protein [Kofleriaceae bacterium]|jgi:ferric-dicitrate binding protein FerR (iron transport regulator)|nr:FecR family protein [Kofleriaceae bacterium]
MTDPLYDKTGDDPEIAALEAVLGDYAHRAPLREPPPRRRRTALTVAAIGAAALAVLAVVLIGRRGADCQTSGAGLAFAVDGGPAQCAGSPAARGTLPVGAWLETPGTAVADVRVADIGRLTVFGDSRVRLVGTGATGHRLELARGRIAARVTAPPRLFVVDTPAASAVDLGCAYELTVEPDGRTRLRVSSGAVSLEAHGAAAYAPMDTEVLAAPGRGPGTPVALSASAALRDAVARFDAGDHAAVPAIVASAGPGDTATLWNLLARTTGDDRAAVFARLDALSPLPAEISADAVRAGDPDAIARWRDALVDRWMCAGCFSAPPR